MKRVLIIAGETSGDLHGALLMRSMRHSGQSVTFRGIGGTRMMEEGLDPIRHVRDMNFMGFIEVVKHLPFIRRTFNDLLAMVDDWKPDIAILIDYPGFNLRLCPLLKKRHIPVMYYISPQLWAWHASRVELVRKYVDRMVVIFPFEVDFYRNHGVVADWVGHPLLDVVRPSSDRESFRASVGAVPGMPLIGLLPGSRRQEVERMLPAMIGAVRLLRKSCGPLAAALGCASELDEQYFQSRLSDADIRPLRNATYDLMAHADILMVASGTATVEAGILGTPMVVTYRTSPLTFGIGKMLVHVEHIGMVNIVAGRRVAPELWQDQVNPELIAHTLEPLLRNPAALDAMRADLDDFRARLGAPGAPDRAAAIAWELLDTPPKPE